MAVSETGGPSPAARVCTSVWVTRNGPSTVTFGALSGVGPMTAMLPSAPLKVQSGVALMSGAALGQALAARVVSVVGLAEDVVEPDPHAARVSTRTAAPAGRAIVLREAVFTDHTLPVLVQQTATPESAGFWPRTGVRPYGGRMPSKSRVVIVVAAATALAGAVALFGLFARSGEPPRSAGPTTIDVQIDGETFALVDGVARNDGPPGSATANTVRVVGDPVAGDLTGDGRDDDALLIANDPGGSGTFYYAVVAVDDGGSYRATNVVPLGDRIATRSIVFTDGRFVYEYLTRKPGEPLSVPPTVPATVSIDYDAASGEIRAQS